MQAAELFAGRGGLLLHGAEALEEAFHAAVEACHVRGQAFAQIAGDLVLHLLAVGAAGLEGPALFHAVEAVGDAQDAVLEEGELVHETADFFREAGDHVGNQRTDGRRARGALGRRRRRLARHPAVWSLGTALNELRELNDGVGALVNCCHGGPRGREGPSLAARRSGKGVPGASWRGLAAVESRISSSALFLKR